MSHASKSYLQGPREQRSGGPTEHGAQQSPGNVRPAGSWLWEQRSAPWTWRTMGCSTMGPGLLRGALWPQHPAQASRAAQPQPSATGCGCDIGQNRHRGILSASDAQDTRCRLAEWEQDWRLLGGGQQQPWAGAWPRSAAGSPEATAQMPQAEAQHLYQDCAEHTAHAGSPLASAHHTHVSQKQTKAHL